MRLKRLSPLAALAVASAALAAPVAYEPPPETRTLAPGPGPGMELALSNCVVCHSLDYITTQPTGLANPQAFWAATVQKMRTVYGLQMEDGTAAAITDYLATAYR